MKRKHCCRNQFNWYIRSHVLRDRIAGFRFHISNKRRYQCLGLPLLAKYYRNYAETFTYASLFSPFPLSFYFICHACFSSLITKVQRHDFLKRKQRKTKSTIITKHALNGSIYRAIICRVQVFFVLNELAFRFEHPSK